jgi:Ca2+/Na+ antiporter
MCIPGLFLGYFLNDSEMGPIVTGITLLLLVVVVLVLQKKNRKVKDETRSKPRSEDKLLQTFVLRTWGKATTLNTMYDNIKMNLQEIWKGL